MQYNEERVEGPTKRIRHTTSSNGTYSNFPLRALGLNQIQYYPRGFVMGRYTRRVKVRGPGSLPISVLHEAKNILTYNAPIKQYLRLMRRPGVNTSQMRYYLFKAIVFKQDHGFQISIQEYSDVLQLERFNKGKASKGLEAALRSSPEFTGYVALAGYSLNGRFDEKSLPKAIGYLKEAHRCFRTQKVPISTQFREMYGELVQKVLEVSDRAISEADNLPFETQRRLAIKNAQHDKDRVAGIANLEKQVEEAEIEEKIGQPRGNWVGRLISLIKK